MVSTHIVISGVTERAVVEVIVRRTCDEFRSTFQQIDITAFYINPLDSDSGFGTIRYLRCCLLNGFDQYVGWSLIHEVVHIEGELF